MHSDNVESDASQSSFFFFSIVGVVLFVIPNVQNELSIATTPPPPPSSPSLHLPVALPRDVTISV